MKLLLLLSLTLFISCEKEEAAEALEKNNKSTNTKEIAVESNSFLGDLRENEEESLTPDELTLFGTFASECIIDGDESIKINMYMVSNVLEISGLFFQNINCTEDGSEALINNVYDMSDFSFVSSTNYNSSLVVEWESIPVNFNNIDNGYKVNGIELNKL